MIAKFLAAWAFLGFSLLLTFPIIMTVCFLGDPDLGIIFASYIASFLVAGAFLSIGISLSATTSNQVIAFVISTAVCLFLILLGFDPVLESLIKYLPLSFVDYLSNLSIPVHFEAIQRGVFDLRDLIYFFSLIFFGLFSGTVILEKFKAD